MDLFPTVVETWIARSVVFIFLKEKVKTADLGNRYLNQTQTTIGKQMCIDGCILNFVSVDLVAAPVLEVFCFQNFGTFI